ncbi:MAG: hypothetical protein NWF01_01345 [Candidatus Bathyarchaeota archaeon]|nr:hypothetical protein [Candidatus Bathyarchaeota archaeon]
MRAKVAVATVQGKAYFLIVNALKEQNIPFFSLIPGQALPAQVKAVITTQTEQDKVNFEKILIFGCTEEELPRLLTEANRILQGKDSYEKIVVGIDPGEVIGFAVVADGKVIYRENCFSVQDAVYKAREVLNTNLGVKGVLIKIGNGVPVYKKVVEALDESLPQNVKLEIVDEAGTNLPLNHNIRSRRLRHIASAIRIASRNGKVYSRGTKCD